MAMSNCTVVQSKRKSIPIAGGSEDNNMWQMTWDELDQDEVRPIPQQSPSGSIYYRCGICGAWVGIYGPKGFHEEG